MTHPANVLKSKRDRADAKMPDVVIEALGDAVGRLRYGVVQLTVHDGRVVQLDVTDRQRFT